VQRWTPGAVVEAWRYASVARGVSPPIPEGEPEEDLELALGAVRYRLPSGRVLWARMVPALLLLGGRGELALTPRGQ